MKIKIGNKIYDPNKEPVMLILDDQDKVNIAAMLPEAKKYCAYPDFMDPRKVECWMDDVRNQRWAHGCVEYYETGWRSGYASKEEAIEAGKQWHEEDFLVAEYRDVTEDDITDGCDFVIFGEEFKVPHSIKENK